MKLFGSKRSGARLAKNRAQMDHDYSSPVTEVSSPSGAKAVVVTEEPAPKKRRNPFKTLAILLAIVFCLELCYFFAIYTNNSFVSHWRNIYIETAMDTLSHKWLANLIIPYDVIAEVADSRNKTMMEQMGQESQWGPAEDDLIDAEVLVPAPKPAEPADPETAVPEPEPEPEPEPDPEQVAKDTFYDVFHEIDKPSFEAYLAAHPEALEGGWANLTINEAGLDDEGTEIMTVQGEKVLALDVPNKILIVRVQGSKNGIGYVGALAIAKDPSRLVLRPASTIWQVGQPVGTIAGDNNGVLAMTGSAFIDPEGGGNGGELAGFAMYDGRGDGYGHLPAGYKRIELHEDNLFYIKDAPSPTGEGTTDAVEFGPALLIDGKIMVDANCGYTGMHPRAAIGQSDKYEILMLAIEGRLPGRSTGTDVIECAEILKAHGCMQAMNLDGGTSAMLWYKGEEIIKCSNTQTPKGRNMPTAWVYQSTPVPSPLKPAE